MTLTPHHPSFDPILEHVWELVSHTPDKLGGQQIPVPPTVPIEASVAESRFSDSFPVLTHLNAALDLIREHGFDKLADLFGFVLPHIRWSQNPSYTEENCSRNLLDGYAYAAFSGPDGPVHCAAPRGGFFLMGPNVTYPAHSHKPKEVYLVLTPGAEWQLDEGDWFSVAAGDLMYHDTWQMHAMRTKDRPLLAFAGWIEPGDRLGIGFSGSS